MKNVLCSRQKYAHRDQNHVNFFTSPKASTFLLFFSKASTSRINLVPSKQSTCMTVSKLFDMSNSKPILLVYTANT